MILGENNWQQNDFRQISVNSSETLRTPLADLDLANVEEKNTAKLLMLMLT